MRRALLHGDDDADDEQGEGHAQQQRVEFTTFGEERGKDAVERGHDGGEVEVGSFGLRRWERHRRVQQLKLRRVVADGFRELGVLLFGQRLNLFLLVVAVLDVLHQRRTDRLIHLGLRAGEVGVEAGKDAVQLLNLGIRRGGL